jgi:hypothetical protein
MNFELEDMYWFSERKTRNDTREISREPQQVIGSFVVPDNHLGKKK